MISGDFGLDINDCERRVVDTHLSRQGRRLET